MSSLPLVRLTRRYGFPASHRLFNPALSEGENRSLYGKCANPFGHGHNYEVEIQVRGSVDAVTGCVVSLADLDRLAEREILVPFRYRNLNNEVPALLGIPPTTENLAAEVARRLLGVWDNAFTAEGPRLEMIRIRETDRNICDLWI